MVMECLEIFLGMVNYGLMEVIPSRRNPLWNSCSTIQGQWKGLGGCLLAVLVRQSHFVLAVYHPLVCIAFHSSRYNLWIVSARSDVSSHQLQAPGWKVKMEKHSRRPEGYMIAIYPDLGVYI